MLYLENTTEFNSISMKKITVIGGGNMGFTYAESIFNSNLETQIHVLEKSIERIQEISALNTISIGSDFSVLKEADVIFLAVKPQISPTVFEEINHFLNKDQLVVSIMAGTTIETIQKGLGLEKVVRAMPNLPAQVKLGMTTYVGSEEVSTEELELVASILETTGKAVLVKTEDDIDKSTGVSGSGPGFVFYMMNAMVNAAENLGFSPEQSKILVSQTFGGAVKLYQDNDISLTEWMNRVSSKGGTTIAGLNHLADTNVGPEIQKCIEVAVARAFELGGKKL
ncbi:pyrroline-5-carboxylate reductase [Flavicella sp.]|uniref:pyrroline-5-carboxylate reductase n=1 Tax=Flavicella sp. TaxID=2957742 RepID=UPI003019738B